MPFRDQPFWHTPIEDTWLDLTEDFLQILLSYQTFFCILAILITHGVFLYCAMRCLHQHLICTFSVALQPSLTKFDESTITNVSDHTIVNRDSTIGQRVLANIVPEKIPSKPIRISLGPSQSARFTILKPSPSSLTIGSRKSGTASTKYNPAKVIREPKYIKKQHYGLSQPVLLTTKSCPKLNHGSYQIVASHYLASNLSNAETVSENKATDAWTMKEAFRAFCRIGARDPFQSEITLSKIDRWFHEAKVFDNRITTVDTAINFKYIARCKRRLNEDDFYRFLDAICSKKNVCRPTLINQLLDCGFPRSHRLSNLTKYVDRDRSNLSTPK